MDTAPAIATADEAWNGRVRPRGPWRRVLARLRRQPLTLVAFGIALAIFAAALFAHELAPRDPTALNLGAESLTPTFHGAHLFGTDALGRDTFSRALYGLRTSLGVSLVVVALATLAGAAVGAVAGYAGGWLDAVLMRVADAILAVPILAAMFTVIVLLGNTTPHTVAEAMVLLLWTWMARVVRGVFFSLRDMDYADAARAAGASSTRIVLRHLLPNAAGPVLVAATFLFGQVILLDTTAEFFGFGINSDRAITLGNLVADGASFGLEQGLLSYWWLWACPAIVIVVLIVCVNFLGDGLDEALASAGGRRR